MDKSIISFIAGAILGIIITSLISFDIENWAESFTSLVLGIASTTSKIWLIFYYVQILPVLVISGLSPLQEKFKIKRLVPLSFALGQATVMIIVVFLSYTIDLFT
jgi:hypothetical protein